MAVGQLCKGFHNLLLEAGAEDKTARKENYTAIVVQPSSLLRGPLLRFSLEKQKKNVGVCSVFKFL